MKQRGNVKENMHQKDSVHRRVAEGAEVKIILFPGEGPENNKARLMTVYIFLASQQKYIITPSASSASLW